MSDEIHVMRKGKIIREVKLGKIRISRFDMTIATIHVELPCDLKQICNLTKKYNGVSITCNFDPEGSMFQFENIKGGNNV